MLFLKIKLLVKKYVNFREIQSLLIILQIYIGFITLLIGLSLIQGLNQYSFQVQSIAALDTFKLVIDPSYTDGLSSKKLNSFYKELKNYKGINNIGSFLIQNTQSNTPVGSQILFLDENFMEWKNNEFIKKVQVLKEYRLENPDSNIIPVVVSKNNILELGEIFQENIPDDTKMTLIKKQFIVIGKINSNHYFWKGQKGDLNNAILETKDLIIAPMQPEQAYGEQMLTRMSYNTYVSLLNSYDSADFSNYVQKVLEKYDLKGKIVTIDQQLADYEKLNKPIIIITLSISSLLLLLSIFGLVGVALMSTARRKKEFGIYFALGSTPRKLGGLIFGEILVNVTLSFILAVSTFLLVNNLLPLDISLLLDIKVLILTFILVLLISMVAAFLPLIRLFKVKPIEYIRRL